MTPKQLATRLAIGEKWTIRLSYLEGVEAYKAGLGTEANPYTNSQLFDWQEWMAGWLDTQFQQKDHL